MGKKRVVFEFDERSLKTLEEMKEIGLSQNTQSTDAEDRLAARIYREATIESLQAQVVQLRRDLGAAESARAKAESKAYRNAAALLKIQIKQARLEGHSVPERLDFCVNRIRALADTPAQEGKDG